MSILESFFKETEPELTEEEKKEAEAKKTEKEKQLAREKLKASNDKWTNNGIKFGSYLVNSLFGSGKTNERNSRSSSPREPRLIAKNLSTPEVKQYDIPKIRPGMESKVEASINKKPAEAAEVDESADSTMPHYMEDRIRKDLIALGVDEKELEGMEPEKAWNLLLQKTLSNEIKNPDEEKELSKAELDANFTILQQLWNDAYDKMESVNDDQATSKIMDVTVNLSDPQELEQYLAEHDSELKPEEKFFIQISIQIKTFRDMAAERNDK
ncbi:MAG TPA: hypothetical protein PK950_03385 [Candidatus Paceibacterota bacterium]|nr:hypothetical protein [Candidatus Paceibacterota bacterium]